MEFRQIEAYVNVVKQKSFSKAAHISNVKQPTISAHVNALEKEMGVKLLDRTHKQTVPTPEGQLFYEYAVNMINMRETALFSIKDFQKSIDGRIRIHASNIPAEYVLPELLCGFQERFPHVKFQIEQYDSKEVMENIRENKAEIGFIGARNNDELGYIPLFEDELVVIMARDAACQTMENRCMEISEFVRYPLILREMGSGTRKAMESLMKQQNVSISDLNIVATVNNNIMVKRLVKEGLGISFISKYAIEEDDRKHYLIRRLEHHDQKRKFYLAYNKKITSTPTVNVFRSFVAEYFNTSVPAE